jgi:hypothetical protein
MSPPSALSKAKYCSKAGALNIPVGKPVPEPFPTAGSSNGSIATLVIVNVPALVFEIVRVLDPADAVTGALAEDAAALISEAICAAVAAGKLK